MAEDAFASPMSVGRYALAASAAVFADMLSFARVNC